MRHTTSFRHLLTSLYSGSLLTIQCHYDRFLIHAGIAFRSAEHAYLRKWAEILRPTYTIPSRYTLVQTMLPSEEARGEKLERERLKDKNFLTLMTDGWDDSLHRSVYGSLAAEVGTRPIVLGLSDLTGHRGTAEKVLEVVEHLWIIARGMSGDVKGNCGVIHTAVRTTIRRTLAESTSSVSTGA